MILPWEPKGVLGEKAVVLQLSLWDIHSHSTPSAALIIAYAPFLSGVSVNPCDIKNEGIRRIIHKL